MTRYELLDRIGVGGMAEIFRGRAVAAGGFEKPVAIKRILPHLSQDRRFVELLIAEAKVLSMLKHRNIVQIFDVGLGDDGQYFLVMEYVDGKDIGTVQRAFEGSRKRVPFDIALHIGAEICEALEHAHVSRGPDGKPLALVHRDVSPTNVLISRAGEVKLTDFGIAKRAESDATNGGAVRGKFAYIAPEQARNETLDPRSDVFSVGILLWELICNRRLFSSLDDMAALRAVRDPIIPKPTEVDGRLPSEIDQLLMTALAKDKQRRYPSCGQLGQKLRALRYSLATAVGDPATDLAKIVASTEDATPQRESGRFDFEGTEATVIRIHTADAFSARDSDHSISQLRQVIDRFEEEETRQAQLTGDQMRMLRGIQPKGSFDELEDEATRTRGPMDATMLDRNFVRASDTPEDPRPLPGVRQRPMGSTNPPSLAANRLIPSPVPAPAPPIIAPWPSIAANLPPRDATPTARDTFDRVSHAKPATFPQVAGFQRTTRAPALRPWVLIVGAIAMALLAFAITRAFLT